MYGFDSEGGISHQHPFEAPDTHIACQEAPAIEQFILQSLNLLAEKNLI